MYDRQYERFIKLCEAYSPSKVYDKQLQAVDNLADRAKAAVDSRLSAKAALAQELTSKLEALNPLAVLNRGFSFITNNGKPAASVSDVKAGDTVDIRFKDGSVKAEIL